MTLITAQPQTRRRSVSRFKVYADDAREPVVVEVAGHPHAHRHRLAAKAGARRLKRSPNECVTVSGDSDGDEMSMVVKLDPDATYTADALAAAFNVSDRAVRRWRKRRRGRLPNPFYVGRVPCWTGRGSWHGWRIGNRRRWRESNSNQTRIVPGCTIWPQPKINPRQRYRITYSTGMKLPSGKPERKTITGSTDLETTVELATKLNRRNERVRTGLDAITEADFDANARRSASEHLDDYRKSLIAAGCDPKHVRQIPQTRGTC